MRLEYRPVDTTKPESTYLAAFRSDVTSQRGEDGVAAKLLDLIGATNRWCVEFGAWDGKKYSNTWALINQSGWNGVLIEGDAARFEDLKVTYRDNPRVKPVNRYVGFGAHSLDTILSELACPTDPDFMSIDIDGMDWHIWDSLEQFKPRLLVIEFNPTIPNDIVFVQARDPRVNQGCSLLALIELGKRKGYELAATTPLNAFFVRADLFPKVGIADNSINAIHNSAPSETKVFQLYDGMLVIAGVTKLLWADYPLYPWMLQPLPRWHRKYPPTVEPWSLWGRIRFRLARLARELI